MRVALVFSVLIAILAVVFALQNPAVVELKLGPALVSGPLAVVLLTTFGAGILVGILAAVPKRFRSRNRIKLLERQLDAARNPEVVEKEIPGDPVGGVPPVKASAPDSDTSVKYAPPGGLR